MKNKKIYISVIIVITIILLSTVIYFCYKNYREKLFNNDSFYQKLSDGFDVNILIVGDSIGAGSGASKNEDKWFNILSNKLNDEYKVKVNIKNVSMGGNTSYAGYVRTMMLDENENYDLVIICYGQNDENSNFSLYYEFIIQAIKTRFPKSSIISFLESSQRTYTEKMKTIQSLSEHYDFLIADTIEPFKKDYDNLTKDGTHPNSDGQKVYSNVIFDVIQNGVTNHRGFDKTNDVVINENVKYFEPFKYIDSKKFKRENNTFILQTEVDGAILAIDYKFNAGNNNCRIFIDEKEFAAPEIYFKYDFSQRHILIVNDWLNNQKIGVKKSIKIIFPDNEEGKKQANGFKGIIISG